MTKNRFLQIKKFACVFSIFFCCALPANAQETSADFSAGHIIVGADADPCIGTIEGAVRYNVGSIQYCDGTTWQTAGGGGGGGCTIGDPVGESICAGRWEDKDLIVTVKGCDFASADAGDCIYASDGTISWGVNSWSDSDASIVDMEQANADYFAYASANAIDVSAKAAGACASLTIDGEDWYLPTIAQLGVIYDNKDTGSWTNGAFSSDEYWSINRAYNGDSVAVTFDFSSGDMSSANNEYNNESVRCVRLD